MAELPTGIVTAVHGGVVDVEFAEGLLPDIDEALIVEWDRPQPLVLEVHAQLDEHSLRGVALHATAGLARGTPVRSTGQTVTVPVGKRVLGRLLDVTGSCQDRGPALPKSTPRWPIHRPPPPLDVQSAANEVFETGIKIIDLLAPVPRGGKAAMFGGAGVGKTVLLMELD